VLRNSIYARNGRKFQDKNLRAYFNSQRWYTPLYNEIPVSRLNKYEKANIEFLKKLEQ
jgi:serine/threonine-protein kinase